MTFVDTTVVVYILGKSHANQEPARRFLDAADSKNEVLVTSAEVLQELQHVYSRQGRFEAVDAALALCQRDFQEIWPLEPEDVYFSRDLRAAHPELQSRDLVHLACCQRRGVSRIATFDKKLAAAAGEAVDWTSYR